jgi:hypothetical protein
LNRNRAELKLMDGLTRVQNQEDWQQWKVCKHIHTTTRYALNLGSTSSLNIWLFATIKKLINVCKHDHTTTRYAPNLGSTSDLNIWLFLFNRFAVNVGITVP